MSPSLNIASPYNGKDIIKICTWWLGGSSTEKGSFVYPSGFFERPDKWISTSRSSNNTLCDIFIYIIYLVICLHAHVCSAYQGLGALSWEIWLQTLIGGYRGEHAHSVTIRAPGGRGLGAPLEVWLQTTAGRHNRNMIKDDDNFHHDEKEQRGHRDRSV